MKPEPLDKWFRRVQRPIAEREAVANQGHLDKSIVRSANPVVRQAVCDVSGVKFSGFGYHRQQCNRFAAAFGVIDKADEAGFVAGAKNRQKTFSEIFSKRVKPG